MPKETFFNLPDEKRERITNESIKEFSNYNFDSASINRIIEGSGISKGSFYQYFEDKKDVYKYLMSVMVSKKLEFMSPVLSNPTSVDIFTLIRELYISGLAFGQAHPEFVDIGNKIMGDKTHPMFNEVIKDNLDQSITLFKGLIEKAKQEGHVRQNIDTDLAGYILTTLNVTVVDYYRQHSGESWDDDLMPFVDQLLEILKYGISTKEEKL